MATVPDAWAIGHDDGAQAPAKDALSQAGFRVEVVPTESQSCYMLALPGQQAEWNAGEVIGQSLGPGSVEPVGSTVELFVCSGA